MEERQARRIHDAIIEYLGLEEDEVKSWEEHEETVEAAEDTSDAPEEAPNRLEILTSIVDNTLSNLDAGIIGIESGEELLATVQAVAALEQMKAGLHVK